MRFMILMIPQVYQGSGPDETFRPNEDDIVKMTEFNKTLGDKGVLRALDGLHPPANAARLSFGGPKPVVTDGPFTETKEVVGGYWIIETKDRAEAVSLFEQCPAGKGDVIEIRQIFDMADFPEDVAKAAMDAGAGTLERS